MTREKLLGAFEDMDYEQLQRWLSELQRKRRLFEINLETYAPRTARIVEHKEPACVVILLADLTNIGETLELDAIGPVKPV